jgi:hypothetical protein
MGREGIGGRGVSPRPQQQQDKRITCPEGNNTQNKTSRGPFPLLFSEKHLPPVPPKLRTVRNPGLCLVHLDPSRGGAPPTGLNRHACATLPLQPKKVHGCICYVDLCISWPCVWRQDSSRAIGFGRVRHAKATYSRPSHHVFEADDNHPKVSSLSTGSFPFTCWAKQHIPQKLANLKRNWRVTRKMFPVWPKKSDHRKKKNTLSLWCA